MPHPLVDQLRFTRSEWLRGLEGISEADATRHFGPMNCISWTVGHLAWQEHRFWMQHAQRKVLLPQDVNDAFAMGAPMTTPALNAALEIWRHVTAAADPFLDTLTSASLQRDLPRDGQSVGRSIGSALRRTTYHYWYHIGEIQAVRQMLGQSDLPQYVGNIEIEAPYRPE
jgi:hypothetical protein